MVPAGRLPELLLRSRRVDRHGTDEPSVGDAAARLRDAQLPRRARVEDAAVVSQPLPGLPARPQVHDTRPVLTAAYALAACELPDRDTRRMRSEEHTSELQSLMRISYAVFCMKKKINFTPTEDKLQIREELFHRSRTFQLQHSKLVAEHK